MKRDPLYNWKKDPTAILLMTVVGVWAVNWILEYLIRQKERSIDVIWSESLMLVIAALLYCIHLVFFTSKRREWPNVWRYAFLIVTVVGWSYMGYLLIRAS